jgi:hypothetical protein
VGLGDREVANAAPLPEQPRVRGLDLGRAERRPPRDLASGRVSLGRGSKRRPPFRATARGQGVGSSDPGSCHRRAERRPLGVMLGWGSRLGGAERRPLSRSTPRGRANAERRLPEPERRGGRLGLGERRPLGINPLGARAPVFWPGHSGTTRSAPLRTNTLPRGREQSSMRTILFG